jgi:hypothetical protein
MWYVTLKNTTDRPIGDIKYRTTYYSETGNVVDKGGVDSILSDHMVQKIIPLKKSRMIEINDGFIHSESSKASFEIVEWKFVDGR